MNHQFPIVMLKYGQIFNRGAFNLLTDMDVGYLCEGGNKIELNYDEDGKVSYIKFQYKTVAILFEASAMSAEEFVEKFSAEYKIPEMAFKDMGVVKICSCTDEMRKFSLSIDDNKNITMKTL